MLVLSRRLGEKIHIGPDIVITLVECDRGRARIGIDCPRDVPIYRAELPPIKQMYIEQRAEANTPRAEGGAE